jgi:5S rRNA maturation endonuclease (ribonuclease M5)
MNATDSILADVLTVAFVEDVLRLAHIEPPAREKKHIRCPLPDHNDSEPSFSIQKSGQGWKCFGCGKSGGVVPLMIALGIAENKGQAVDLLAGRYRIATSTKTAFAPRQAVKAMPQFEIRTPAPRPTVSAEDQADFDKALRGRRKLMGLPNTEGYLKGRGIDPGFASSCRVGAHPEWLGGGSAVLFPGYDESGTLVCAQGRFLAPREGIKTRSKGFIKLGVFATPGAFVRGYKADAGPVAIVEGPIDALSLAQAGLPSIALFGAGNRQAWLRKALAFRKVILALDDDKAGDGAAKELQAWLNLGTKVSRMSFGGHKDANEALVADPTVFASLVEEAIRLADPLRGMGGAISHAQDRAKTSSDVSEHSPAPQSLALALPGALEGHSGRVAEVANVLEVVSGLTLSEPEAEDGLLLLDYVGSVFGWHEDWHEAWPSNWDELPLFGDSVKPYPSLP